MIGEYICLYATVWSKRGVIHDGPKKDDIVHVIGSFHDGCALYYQLKEYPYGGYIARFFAPVAPQSAIDNLMKEVDKLVTV